MSLFEFAERIVYTGRGVENRFLAHLFQAHKYAKAPATSSKNPPRKLTRILKIWKKRATHILKIDVGKHAEKCDFLECCMILTLWSSKLTNAKLNGIASTPIGFTIDDIYTYGKSLLVQFYKDRKNAIVIHKEDNLLDFLS